MSTSESAADRDADASIHLHAELLPNIRQLTLYVSLPAYPDSDLNGNAFHPQISLSESRRAVTVSLTGPDHEMSETIKLPARVSEASRASLKFTGHRASTEGRSGGDGDVGREYSFRMQVDKDEEQPRVAKEDFVDDFIPWTATDMTASTGVRCRACGHVILDPSGPPRPSSDTTAEGSAPPPSRGWVWKDLPSGNWAEMMDFWHCHKPHNPEQDHLDKNSEVKGYGAANQVVATPGTVLVDVPSFLVTEVDCKGLRKSQQKPPAAPSSTARGVSLECEGCNALVGTEDITARGWRLFKAALSVRQFANAYTHEEGEANEESTWETQPTETIVGAQLLEMIEREGVRRFVLHCGEKDGLLLWVFNPDLRYSSSSADRSITAQRAMKIFMQPVSNIESLLDPEQGKGQSITLEELYLPANIFAEVDLALRRNNEILPASARRFREWEVTFLKR
ncbi:hypothetical protein VTN00DRAFT_6987 [Thermoascus crustaceus]|uniref:uncharacterized protein n=1 Tax=Thermoascus crustaceus TaxID=5088 RepID=UPI0037424380